MDALKDVISKVLNLEYEKVRDDLTRDSAEEWDSFNHLMLMSEIEKTFHVSFSLKEIENAKSLIDIRTLLSQKKS